MVFRALADLFVIHEIPATQIGVCGRHRCFPGGEVGRRQHLSLSSLAHPPQPPPLSGERRKMPGAVGSIVLSSKKIFQHFQKLFQNIFIQIWSNVVLFWRSHNKKHYDAIRIKFGYIIWKLWKKNYHWTLMGLTGCAPPASQYGRLAISPLYSYGTVSLIVLDKLVQLTTPTKLRPSYCREISI